MQRFIPFFCLLLLILLGFGLNPTVADAKVKVTVQNNLSHPLYLAFCWRGQDIGDDIAKGWYKVEAGASRILSFNAVFALTNNDFGFYAKGKDANGKKFVWSGKERDVVVHPTKAFSKQPEEALEGGIKVGFRKLKIKEVQDGTRENGTAKLTFSPPADKLDKKDDREMPPELTSEKEKLFGEWTVTSELGKGADARPYVAFWHGKPKAFINASNDYWEHVEYSWDPETSAYVLYLVTGSMTKKDGKKLTAVGTARIIPGSPDRLVVEGYLPHDHVPYATRVLEFTGELVRMKSNPATLQGITTAWEVQEVERKKEITESSLEAFHGSWITLSGSQLELYSIGEDSINIDFLEAGPGSANSGDVEWDEDRAEFVVRGKRADDSIYEFAHFTVRQDEQGKFTLMDIVCNVFTEEGERIYRATLQKQYATLVPCPDDIMQKLYGEWVSTSGLEMTIFYSPEYKEHHTISLGESTFRMIEPQWDTATSELLVIGTGCAYFGEVPITGADGKVYERGRFCTMELSHDEKTLTLTGVYVPDGGKPKSFKTVLAKKTRD